MVNDTNPDHDGDDAGTNTNGGGQEDERGRFRVLGGFLKFFFVTY